MTLIAISGPHGSGKSTLAKALAEKLNLRYLSAGTIFRKLAREYNMSIIEFTYHVAKHPEIDMLIDQSMREEAKKGNAVLDSQLAYWMVKDLNPIKILVTAEKKDRIIRLMEREKLSYEAAKKEIEIREEEEKKRFKSLYGVDLWNPDDFHIVINTSKLTKKESLKLIICMCKELVDLRKGEFI